MSDDGTKLKKYSASLHGGSTGEPGWVLSLASLVASNRWETVRAPVEVACYFELARRFYPRYCEAWDLTGFDEPRNRSS